MQELFLVSLFISCSRLLLAYIGSLYASTQIYRSRKTSTENLDFQTSLSLPYAGTASEFLLHYVNMCPLWPDPITIICSNCGRLLRMPPYRIFPKLCNTKHCKNQNMRFRINRIKPPSLNTTGTPCHVFMAQTTEEDVSPNNVRPSPDYFYLCFICGFWLNSKLYLRFSTADFGPWIYMFTNLVCTYAVHHQIWYLCESRYYQIR